MPMPAACRALTVVIMWGGAPETLSDAGRGNFIDAKKWRSWPGLFSSHTRAWRDSLNRCGCEPDDSGRAMASWLSRRSNRRRPGGRGNSWRSTRGPRPYYDAYAYEPVYFGPRCYIRRERFWDGWRWHVHRVEDCY